MKITVSRGKQTGFPIYIPKGIVESFSQSWSCGLALLLIGIFSFTPDFNGKANMFVHPQVMFLACLCLFKTTVRTDIFLGHYIFIFVCNFTLISHPSIHPSCTYHPLIQIFNFHYWVKANKYLSCAVCLLPLSRRKKGAICRPVNSSPQFK